MRLTSKGQVTIPQPLRDELGMRPGDEVRFERDGDALRLTKADARTRGERLLAQMRRTATAGLSTEEIMALTRGDE